MRSQKVKVEKDDKGIGGDTLPLCYSYFELIWNMIKASKKKQKEGEMVQSINLYGREDDKEK